MKLRKRKPVTTHPGIRLRISNLNGVLISTDSDHLFYTAKFGGGKENGWLEIIPGQTEYGPAYLYARDEPRQCHMRIEIQPVMLDG